jgi:hypothetical protein
MSSIGKWQAKFFIELVGTWSSLKPRKIGSYLKSVDKQFWL